MLATPPTLPCPKCGSTKDWLGPQFRGSVGWLAPEHLEDFPVIVTMNDGRELIDRETVRIFMNKLKQRLEYECKVCNYCVSTPTLDQQ